MLFDALLARDTIDCQAEQMRGTYDEAADAVYLRLVEPVAGQSKHQSAVEADGLRPGAMVAFDFDDEGYLVGIEVRGARDLLRGETLAAMHAPGSPDLGP
jgi:uncharacterized protein YuzE